MSACVCLCSQLFLGQVTSSRPVLLVSQTQSADQSRQAAAIFTLFSISKIPSGRTTRISSPAQVVYCTFISHLFSSAKFRLDELQEFPQPCLPTNMAIGDLPPRIRFPHGYYRYVEITMAVNAAPVLDLADADDGALPRVLSIFQGRVRFRADDDHPVQVDPGAQAALKLGLATLLHRAIAGAPLLSMFPKFLGYLSNPPSTSMKMATFAVFKDAPNNFNLERVRDGPLMQYEDRIRFKTSLWFRQNQAKSVQAWMDDFGEFIEDSWDSPASPPPRRSPPLLPVSDEYDPEYDMAEDSTIVYNSPVACSPRITGTPSATPAMTPASDVTD